jgi:spore maturation protein CgeB
VLVHEWNEPQLVARIGQYRARNPSCRLLFHDTHHRAATAPDELARYDLRHYDGVLAFGKVIRDLYLENGWTEQAWVWHEAADLRVFSPRVAEPERDVVWIGNWGDEERTAELHEFLMEPALELKLTGSVHGVRYPPAAREALVKAGLEYRGWIPNYRVPEAFARYRLTVHVPRRPYARMLPGIPTIRVFEALACGVPLISAPWDDCEGLFSAGEDYLVAGDGREMKRLMREVLGDPKGAQAMAARGRRTVAQRHTCAHRTSELLAIASTLGVGGRERMLAS